MSSGPPPPPSGSVTGAQAAAMTQAASQSVPGAAIECAFVFDGTASMGDYLGNATQFARSLATYVERLRSVNRDDFRVSSVKLAIVVYRDFGDSPQIEVLDFTSDLNSFASFADGLRPKGGGDFAEDVEGGLTRTRQLSWTPGRSDTLMKLCFLCLDAPPHGADMHDLGEAGDERLGTSGAGVLEAIRQLSADNIQLSVFAVNQHEYGGRLNKFRDAIAPVVKKHSSYDLQWWELGKVSEREIIKFFTRNTIASLVFRMSLSAGSLGKRAPTGPDAAAFSEEMADPSTSGGASSVSRSGASISGGLGGGGPSRMPAGMSMSGVKIGDSAPGGSAAPSVGLGGGGGSRMPAGMSASGVRMADSAAVGASVSGSGGGGSRMPAGMSVSGMRMADSAPGGGGSGVSNAEVRAFLESLNPKAFRLLRKKGAVDEDANVLPSNLPVALSEDEEDVFDNVGQLRKLRDYGILARGA